MSAILYGEEVMSVRLYANVQVKTVDSNVVIFCLTYADVAMSNGIESFLVVYGPKDKKIDIIDNFNK